MQALNSDNVEDEDADGVPDRPPRTGPCNSPLVDAPRARAAAKEPWTEPRLRQSLEVPTEDGPFGARAVAEPPGFGPPAAIANAIEDAVGVRIKELPLSPDRILRALQGEPPEEISIDLELLRKLRSAGGPIQWASAG